MEKSFQVSKSKKLLLDMFEESIFASSLFYEYQNRGALRFDLESRSSNEFKYFIDSFVRALEIANFIFKKQEKILVYCYQYVDEKKLSSKKIINFLKKYEILTDNNYEFFIQEKIDEFGEKEYKRFCCFESKITNLSSLLWIALNKNYNIAPLFETNVYLINKDKSLLLHPYDERGMDIISKDFSYMRGLYNKFNTFLLEHDIKSMDKLYK